MKSLFALFFLLGGVNLQAAVNAEDNFSTLFGAPLEMMVAVFFTIMFIVVIALIIEPVEE